MSAIASPPQPIASLEGRLPAFGPAAAALARTTRSARLGPAWSALAARAGLSLAPVDAPFAGPVHALRLACEHGAFTLLVSAPGDAGFAFANAPDLEPPLRTLALEALIAPLRRRLEGDALLAGLRAEALSEADGTGATWVSARTPAGELARLALGELPAAMDEALRRRARRAPAHDAWRHTLRLPGRAAVASLGLPFGVLRTLASGDVVVLPGAAAGFEDAAVSWRAGPAGGRRPTAPAAIRGGALHFTGELQMIEDDEAPLGADPDEADALDELELPVRFELETVAMSLADLEAVRPGYVIEFAQPVACARLRMVCCGRVVGQAELVAVGDGLGARITRMVARDGHEQSR